MELLRPALNLPKVFSPKVIVHNGKGCASPGMHTQPPATYAGQLRQFCMKMHDVGQDSIPRQQNAVSPSYNIFGLVVKMAEPSCRKTLPTDSESFVVKFAQSSNDIAGSSASLFRTSSSAASGTATASTSIALGTTSDSSACQEMVSKVTSQCYNVQVAAREDASYIREYADVIDCRDIGAALDLSQKRTGTARIGSSPDSFSGEAKVFRIHPHVTTPTTVCCPKDVNVLAASMGRSTNDANIRTASTVCSTNDVNITTASIECSIKDANKAPLLIEEGCSETDLKLRIRSKCCTDSHSHIDWKCCTPSNVIHKESLQFRGGLDPKWSELCVLGPYNNSSQSSTCTDSDRYESRVFSSHNSSRQNLMHTDGRSCLLSKNSMLLVPPGCGQASLIDLCVGWRETISSGMMDLSELSTETDCGEVGHSSDADSHPEVYQHTLSNSCDFDASAEGCLDLSLRPSQKVQYDGQWRVMDSAGHDILPGAVAPICKDHESYSELSLGTSCRPFPGNYSYDLRDCDGEPCVYYERRPPGEDASQHVSNASQQQHDFQRPLRTDRDDKNDHQETYIPVSNASQQQHDFQRPLRTDRYDKNDHQETHISGEVAVPRQSYREVQESPDAISRDVTSRSEYYQYNRIEMDKAWLHGATEDRLNKESLQLEKIHYMDKYEMQIRAPISEGHCDPEERNSPHVLSFKRKRARQRIYLCPMCTVTCSNRGQLLGHLRTHTGERPFPCPEPECRKTFVRNEELTRHRRIHTGERPYTCNTCAKAFTRKDHLNKHARMHTIDVGVTV